MMRQPGEMSLRKAATILSVKVKTVRTWARKAWDGSPSQLAYGRKDPSGQWFVRAEEVERVLAARRERERRILTQGLPDPDAA
jgi:transposase